LQDRHEFRHKERGAKAMRTRNSESMGWGSGIAVGTGVLVLLAAIALSVYGGRVAPVQHPVEQIIPNERLPN
jgi:hypothetical protein